MPQLNLNVVLTSPMFVDSFTVTRRVQSVDGKGRMQETDTVIAVTGAVHGYGDNAQERPKEYATGRKSIAVYTAFRLRAQSDGFVPDIVTWRDNDFLVEAVWDATHLSAGFVQAYCTSQDLQDQPPQEF